MPVPPAYVRNAVSLACGRVSRQAPRPTGPYDRICLNSSSRRFTAFTAHTTQRRAGIHMKWLTRSMHSKQSNARQEEKEDSSSDTEKEHVHHILTFTPEMFSVVGQGMVDFSTSRWVYAGKTPTWVVFSYPADPPAKKDNFPPDTRGYLYYQKSLPGEHAMAGGLQFRLMPPDTLSFDEGKDLLHKDGLPWKVPLYSIVHFKAYAPILEGLLLEGTVTEDLVTHVKQMPVRRFSRRSAILYESSDTFIADLGRWPRFVHLIMPGSVVTIDSFISRVFYCKSSGRSPYQGRLRLRLEKSALPQHADSYHATVRVIEILEPIRRVVSGENFEIAEPFEGELIRRRSSLGTEYKAYTCKLSGTPSEILHTFFNGHV